MSTVATTVGKFVWHEQVSSDPKQAQDFYTQLFGWDTEVFKPGEADYTMISSGGQSHGGFGKAMEGASPSSPTLRAPTSAPTSPRATSPAPRASSFGTSSERPTPTTHSASTAKSSAGQPATWGPNTAATASSTAARPASPDS